MRSVANLLLAILFTIPSFAFQTELKSSPVPTKIRYSGTVTIRGEQSSQLSLTFTIYGDEGGIGSLWSETQTVAVDEKGRYSVLLGSQNPIDATIFGDGEQRWLGVRVNGGTDESRVVMVSVPYAMKAADAATLGGKPASAYLLNPVTSKRLGTESGQAPAPETSAALPVTTGTTDGTTSHVPKFASASTLVDTQMVEDVNGFIGIGTNTPQGRLGLETNVFFGGLVIGQNSPPNTNPKHLLLGYDTTLNFGAISSVQENVGYTNLAFQPDGGLVGIGTRFPAGAKLGIEATTANNGLLIGQNNAANARQLIFGYDVAGNYGSITAVQQGVGYTTLALQPKGGNVGIGTLAPTSKLDVVGNSPTQVAHAVQLANGPGVFSFATQPPSAVRGDAIGTSGYLGGVFGSAASNDAIGVVGQNSSATGNSIGVLGVTLGNGGTGLWGEATAPSGDAVGLFGRSASNSGTGVFGLATATTGDAVGVFGRSTSAGGTGVWGEVTAGSGANYGVYGRNGTATTTSAAGTFDAVTGSNILLGRSGASLGTVTNVFRVDSTGRGFFNGTAQTGGADFAESVAVRENKAEYQPGDVIGIDTDGIRRFTKLAKPYSTLVAGIYSTKPGILATPHDINSHKPDSEEIPLAVVGIVPCKVSGENGPIHTGDLLVSSSTPGYAMKGTDRSRLNGAVIGKALQPMESAHGVIEVLVSLQ